MLGRTLCMYSHMVGRAVVLVHQTRMRCGQEGEHQVAGEEGGFARSAVTVAKDPTKKNTELPPL